MGRACVCLCACVCVCIQAACAHRWARLIEKSLQLVSRAQGAYPTHTIAQRLAGRTLALRDPWSPPLAPRSDTQLVGLVLAAWRSWARNKKRARQVRASVCVCVSYALATLGGCLPSIAALNHHEARVFVSMCADVCVCVCVHRSLVSVRGCQPLSPQ